VNSISTREKIYQAAEQLAAQKPYDQITFAEIADLAGVHWTAVRRHYENKQKMRSWLLDIQTVNNTSFQDTRTRVLRAATELFAEQGYVHSSLDKVALRAGLSKGAVYWHFSSKQDLFLVILEQNLSQELHMLSSQIEAVLGVEHPLNAINNWLEMLFDCMESGSFMLFLEFVTTSREPEVQKKLQEIYGNTLNIIGDIMKEMQRKGYFAQNIDPHALWLMIDSLVKGMMMEWLINPESFQDKAVLQTISKVLWNGMAPKSE
jgi:AcrR family transcriptional regulator